MKTFLDPLVFAAVCASVHLNALHITISAELCLQNVDYSRATTTL